MEASLRICSQFSLFAIVIFYKVAMGEGNVTPLQYSCLGNPMEGGTWWAAVHGVMKSQI